MIPPFWIHVGIYNITWSVPYGFVLHLLWMIPSFYTVCRSVALVFSCWCSFDFLSWILLWFQLDLVSIPLVVLPSFTDLLNSIARGPASSTFSSFKIRGYLVWARWLIGVQFSSFFMYLGSVIVMSFTNSPFDLSSGGICGMFDLSSTVRTLEKNLINISAFSWSLVA